MINEVQILNQFSWNSQWVHLQIHRNASGSWNRLQIQSGFRRISFQAAISAATIVLLKKCLIISNNIAIKLLTSLLFSPVSPSRNHFFILTLTLTAERHAMFWLWCSLWSDYKKQNNSVLLLKHFDRQSTQGNLTPCCSSYCIEMTRGVHLWIELNINPQPKMALKTLLYGQVVGLLGLHSRLVFSSSAREFGELEV